MEENERRIQRRKVEEGPTNSNIVFVKKVAEKARDWSYIATFAGFGLVVLVVGRGLFSGMLSSNSPQRLYQKAAKIVKKDPDVTRLLGTPIKSHGEGSRRRSHVAEESFYDQESRLNKRIKFYVKGPHGSGVVYCHFVQEGGNFRLMNLFVDCNEAHRVVLVRNGEEMVSADA